jgi:phage-related protein
MADEDDETSPEPMPLVFFRTNGGNEPAREWLRKLPSDDRGTISDDLRTVQFGWPLGMPLVRPLGGGLHEVRSRLKNRIARVIFCVSGGEIVVLHGFIKKTQKTPKSDLKIAKDRQSEYES